MVHSDNLNSTQHSAKSGSVMKLEVSRLIFNDTCLFLPHSQSYPQVYSDLHNLMSHNGPCYVN